MKRKRTDPREQARVAELLAIVLDGAEFFDAEVFVAEKVAGKEPPWDGPAPAASTLAAYLDQVDAKIAASCKSPPAKLLKRHLAQRRSLFAKAVSQGDVRAALACLRDEATLEGLYDRKPERRRRKSKAAPLLPADGTPADVVKLLAATIEQLGKGQLDVKTANAIGTLAVLRMKAQVEANAAEETGRLLEMMNAANEPALAGDDETRETVPEANAETPPAAEEEP